MDIFFKFRVSSEFRKQWQDLMSQSLTEPVPHILYQRLADILFKKSLEERVTVLNAQECDIEPLTRIEENALRYAAGYVCKNVARKLKKSSLSIKEKEDIIHCMDQLKDDGQSETQCDSSIWIDAIDRGGLWRVNDTVFPVFYAMEEDVRRNIKHKSISQVSLNVAALRASIIGNHYT